MSQRIGLYPGDSVRTDDSWYKIAQEISSTADAVVYLVTQTEGEYVGNNFALKLFKNIDDENRVRRFQDERELLKEIDHPSILRYYDQGKYDDYPFLVSEYFPTTLREKIDDDDVSLPTKLSYSVQLLSALSYLEQQEPSIIHRDIKPSNVFIRGDTCYLGDFGLMKRVGTRDKNEIGSFESSDVAMNKWQYRTQELVDFENGDRDNLPPESDVFQLGLVLIELFTENSWNPQVPKEDPLSDVEIDPKAYRYIDGIQGGMGDGVGKLLRDMITEDADERPKASEIMDDWMGRFEDVSEAARIINGQVFY